MAQQKMTREAWAQSQEWVSTSLCGPQKHPHLKDNEEDNEEKKRIL